MHAYTQMHKCAHIHEYVRTHMRTHARTDRQTDRRTGRQADGQTDITFNNRILQKAQACARCVHAINAGEHGAPVYCDIYLSLYIYIYICVCVCVCERTWKPAAHASSCLAAQACATHLGSLGCDDHARLTSNGIVRGKQNDCCSCVAHTRQQRLSIPMKTKAHVCT